MDIIIELTSRSRRVIERYSFRGDRITIGRAYDNDLIISDPHISPHHAVLTDNEDSGWQIEDMDSKNGIFTRKHLRIDHKTTLNSGDEIVLGKSHLRIYDRLHPVPDALSMNPVEKVIQPLNKTWNAAIVVVFAMAIFALDSYLELYVDLEFRHIFADMTGLALVGTCWAAIWAFTGRIMRHDARFFLQLVVVMAYLVCEIIYSNFLDLLAFNSGAGSATFLIGIAGHYILFSSLLWLNMYIAISQSDRKRFFMSFGISSIIVVMALIYYLLNIPEFTGVPEYVHYLKPPLLQWFEPVTTDTFLEDSGVIFEKAASMIKE